MVLLFTETILNDLCTVKNRILNDNTQRSIIVWFPQYAFEHFDALGETRYGTVNSELDRRELFILSSSFEMLSKFLVVNYKLMVK